MKTLCDPKANARWRAFWVRVQRAHAKNFPAEESHAGVMAKVHGKANNKKAPPQ